MMTVDDCTHENAASGENTLAERLQARIKQRQSETPWPDDVAAPPHPVDKLISDELAAMTEVDTADVQRVVQKHLDRAEKAYQLAKSQVTVDGGRRLENARAEVMALRSWF